MEWFLKKKWLTVSIQNKEPFSSSEPSALVSESLFNHPAFVVLFRALVILLCWIEMVTSVSVPISIKVVTEWICIPKKLFFRFVVAFRGVELIAVRVGPCRHIGSELGCIPNIGL